LANRRMMMMVRLWEEKEWGECNQICHYCHHQDKGGSKDLMIATLGRDDTHPILPRACTWSCRMYNWQLEREEAQRRMRWKMKMMDEEWLWEEERIAARITAMLMGMGMGTDMGMGYADAMMQS
jgi:hypothetical protein